MGKINGKVILIIIWLLMIGLLVYSRFVNLNWGLPYQMHPDERNMVDAIRQLNCHFSSTNWWMNFQNCFNPKFFAYGQFPLYLGYFITYFLKFFDGDLRFSISMSEATISLRIISAVASMINVFVLLKIIALISNIKDQISNPSSKFKTFNFTLSFALCTLIFTFSPYAIQFAHFGTTESLLILFYSLIIYLSLLLQESRTTASVVWLALVSGLAIATKASSILFTFVPLITILTCLRSWDRYKNLFKFGVLTIIFMVIFSPHNFINFNDFIGSMNYESEVALGKLLVFYTRQFFNTQPILFQFEKIFPYALGLPVFVMGLIGLMSLDWTNRKINLLRFGFLVYFIPSAIIFAKWSRFMAPVFPIMLIFAMLIISNIKDQISKLSSKFKVLRFTLGFALCALIFAMIIPGIAYLSVYQNHDVRFQASQWIYKNISNNSYILSETANVVDIPVESESYKVHKVYKVISFNFYDLDENLQLQEELKEHLRLADYIFVPSRRIFFNLNNRYPLLDKYYSDLFSGKLGFKKVAEFESHPKIFQWKFPDEQAEETWTVFDHPVIRIYKKTK